MKCSSEFYHSILVFRLIFVVFSLKLNYAGRIEKISKSRMRIFGSF